MFEMEIGNDIDELRNDDRVKFILQLSDSDDNSSESGFSEVSYGHVIGHSDTQNWFYRVLHFRHFHYLVSAHLVCFSCSVSSGIVFLIRYVLLLHMFSNNITPL